MLSSEHVGSSMMQGSAAGAERAHRLIGFGRVGEPELTADGVLLVASQLDYWPRSSGGRACKGTKVHPAYLT
jgi:hypothetical protein